MGASALKIGDAKQEPLHVAQFTRVMLLIFGPLAEFMVRQVQKY